MRDSYLFECVVARDKNDGESLKSMCRSTVLGFAKGRHLREYASLCVSSYGISLETFIKEGAAIENKPPKATTAVAAAAAAAEAVEAVEAVAAVAAAAGAAPTAPYYHRPREVTISHLPVLSPIPLHPNPSPSYSYTSFLAKPRKKDEEEEGVVVEEEEEEEEIEEEEEEEEEARGEE
uniref:Uncharacterized protein n=1 Tax=Vespula pensylvanica TaxID=30213 RepID=A0A834P6J6_VESPE|nr:hypothetical protein H0235_006301 [Vespula pensylvanica]